MQHRSRQSKRRWLASALVGVVLVGVVLGLCAPLSAQTPQRSAPNGEQDPIARQQRPSAQMLDRRARRAMQDQEYADAIELWLRAQQIAPDPQRLYRVGRAYQAGEDCARALIYYDSFLARASADTPARRRAQRALEQSDECAGYLDSLAGRVVITSEPSGALVWLDGERLGTSPVEVAGLSQGAHRIRVQKQGFEIARDTIELAAGEDTQVAVELVRRPIGGGPPDDATPVLLETEQTGYTPEFVALSVMGAGALAIATGAFYDLYMVPDTEDEREEFEPNTDAYDDLTQERDFESTVATVGYIGGSVLVAGGLTWLLVDYLDFRSADDVGVGLRAGPDGTVFTFDGRF